MDNFIHGSLHLSDDLLPAVYDINTQLSIVTTTGPYQIMFRQEPHSDSDFWKIMKKSKIIDEENFLTSLADSNADIVYDQTEGVDDCEDIIEEDAIQLVHQLLDDVVANSLVNLSLSHSPSGELPQPRYDLIQKIDINNYLNVANKKLKHYQDNIINKTEEFNLNECAGGNIQTVDRTNSDAKI